MSTKQLNAADVINLPASATATTRPAEDNAAGIEIAALPSLNDNDVESAAVSSNDTESNRSSDAAAEDARQEVLRPAYVKRGGSLVMAAAALGALIVGVNSSVHLAGRPTKNFSSSKQVAVTSEEVKIKGFTFVGDGLCSDEGGNTYDYVIYSGVVDAEACAKKCSKCPGRGQTDVNSVELVLRGFEFVRGGCACLVEDGAEFTTSVCKDATEAGDGLGGSGEIKSAIKHMKEECWKINSKSSKSPKSGSKGGKRG